MSPPIPSHSGATPAATEMEDAVAGGGDFAVTTPAPEPTCPVCMEPWTCNGDHRICCIPCGHVYGRSCLERWLHRCGDDSAKCPQCGELFEDNLIINLYAPGNLWDGCCRLQELKEHYESEIHEIMAENKDRWEEDCRKREERWEEGRRKQEETERVLAEMKEQSQQMHKMMEWVTQRMITYDAHFAASGVTLPDLGPPPPFTFPTWGQPSAGSNNVQLGGTSNPDETLMTPDATGQPSINNPNVKRRL